MCFITPKRLRCGKASTICVVVRGPCRNKSRIERRVMSDNAFHTASSSSVDTSPPLCLCLRGAILGDSLQHVPPASADTLTVRRIDETDGAVTEVHMGSSRPLFEPHLNVVQCRVRHEHWAAQFHQYG